MAYGIYKFLGITLSQYSIEDNLSAAYDDTAIVINSLVEKNKIELEANNKTFSFNGYFKKPKCRYDFNKEKGIIESDNLIEEIKNIR